MHASAPRRISRLPLALKALACILAAACAAWWLMFGWLVYRAPLPYTALDFDHDGRVSLGEAEYAATYSTRPIQSGGKACVEYFSLKDGLPLTTRCSPAP